MVATAETVEWIQVRNEVEALMLEYSLIKQHRPRFNIRLRDDKSYPFLAVTLDDEWPRAMVMRGRKRKGVRYFGPYAPRLRHPRDARPAAAHLPDPHLLATASSAPTSGSAGRACCSTSRSARGPCVGEIDHEALRPSSSRSCSTSSTATPTRSSSASTAEMREAADELEFERAARLRDRLDERAPRPSRSQQMVADRNEDLDVIGIADDDLEAAVQVFYVRKGRVVGRKGFIVDKVEDLDAARASSPASSRSSTATSRRSACPSRCWCPIEPEQLDLYEEWLTDAARLAGRGAGAAAGRQARAARDRHPQREGGVHPPPLAPGHRPQQPGPGAQRAAGRTSACPRRRCGSSATT